MRTPTTSIMHDGRQQMQMQMGVSDGWTDGSEKEMKCPRARYSYATEIKKAPSVHAQPREWEEKGEGRVMRVNRRVQRPDQKSMHKRRRGTEQISPSRRRREQPRTAARPHNQWQHKHLLVQRHLIMQMLAGG